jgi:hypothetical protein
MMKKVLFGIWCFGLLSFGYTGSAQRDYKGYLGVLVSPDDHGGMAIEGFIRNTPASKLSMAGEIRKGDVIVKLAGKKVESLKELTRARDSIPFGKEGKMVLRGRNNTTYYIWISRKDPAVARAAIARGESAEAAQTEAADVFSAGGKGEGEGEEDIRDARDTAEEVTTPEPIRDEEGDIR